MSKIVSLILITVLVVYLLRRMAGKRVDQSKSPPPAGNKAAEDMVRCHACGVNLPRSEAILSQGRFYCCDEHRKSGG